jgi:hypothetical protein
MIRLQSRRKNTGTAVHEIKDFRGLVNKLLDEARVDDNEAVTATNLIWDQDGLPKPRWGTAYYGADLGANCDGSAEYLKSDGTTELIAVAGGVAYKSTNGGSWTSITGATFTAGLQCYFLQIAGYLYIANGTDNLARYDGSVLTTYSSISAPTGVSGARASGLSSGSYTYYCQVTALNDIGETVGSTEASVTTNKLRDNWYNAAGSGITEAITWSWTVASGASRYQVYISDESGDEALLTSTTASSFQDDGTLAINPYVTPPLQNTTAAPKFTSMVVSGNRMWGTNDSNSRYTVHFSGTGTFMGVFSDFYGGGWINLEKGGRETPVKVVHYQTGQGEGRATVLCKTPEGRGAVWQISISSITVGDTSFSVPSAVKIVGSWGTEAQNSVVSDGNNIMFANRKGWFSLGPQQNYYGILRTNEISSKIRPYWNSLIGSKISGIASYFYDAKIFISVPTTSTGNTRIIILDTERQGWIVDWSFGVKNFLEYTDTSGVTHFLYVPNSGTKLIEIGENIAGDLGVSFDTEFATGRLNTAKLWKDFMKIGKVYLKLGSPRGTINFEVSGTQRRKSFQAIASKTISPTYSLTGMGWDLMGEVQMGSTSGTPTTFSDSSDPHYVRIGKTLRDIKMRITTSGVDTDYILHGFIIEGKPTRTPPPSDWEL